MQPTLTSNPVKQYKKTQRAAAIQKLLNWFVFFLAFPAIDLLGNSITFYIFILLLARVGSFWQIAFPAKFLFLGYLLVVISATVLGPYSGMPRYPGFLYSVQILIQYVYWILVAAFLIRFRSGYSLYELGKWVFYGVVAALLGFYFFTFKVNLGIMEVYTGTSRNAFVFAMLSCLPLTYFYLLRRFGYKAMPYVILAYIFLILLTNGRSGAIIILLQTVLIAGILYPGFLRLARWLMIPLISVFLVVQSSFFQPVITGIADQVESISPRFADLLRGEEEGDLSFDKSWLLRKLMIDKSTEIFKEHPVLGIGANNFTLYDSELVTMDQYDRLRGQSKEFYNSRSAHNTYILVLSEFGLIGFVLFLLILLIPVFRAMPLIRQKVIRIEYIPLVSLIGIVCHFYAISSITGAIGWMVIGLAWASISGSLKSKKVV